MTLLVSWSVQVLDSRSEPSCYFPAVSQMYFKWEEGNHLKAFLQSPVFFHASMSPKAMTLAFMRAPSNANDNIEITYKSVLLLGHTTLIPTTSHVQMFILPEIEECSAHKPEIIIYTKHIAIWSRQKYWSYLLSLPSNW